MECDWSKDGVSWNAFRSKLLLLFCSNVLRAFHLLFITPPLGSFIVFAFSCSLLLTLGIYRSDLKLILAPLSPNLPAYGVLTLTTAGVDTGFWTLATLSQCANA